MQTTSTWQRITGQILFSLWLAVGVSASAATINWQAAVNGNFSDGTKWTGGTAPGAADEALFDVAGSYAVTLTGAVTNQRLRFDAPSGTVSMDLAGFNYVLTIGGNSLQLGGSGGPAQALISNGTISGADKLAVGQTTDNNLLEISGNTTVLDWNGTFGDLYAGVSGSGNTLKISAGAQAFYTRAVAAPSNFAGSPGGGNTVWVTGADSHLESYSTSPFTQTLLIGRNSAGNSLIIDDGGELVTSMGYIGDTAGTSNNNSALIDGANSLWTVGGTLSVGENGNANTLTISNGGALVTSQTHIGGFGSNGQLTISGGGTLTGSHLRLGQRAASSGNIGVVDGVGSSVTTTSFDVNVGEQGDNNSLTIQNGGLVDVARTIYAGNAAGADGNAVTVTGSGSTLQIGSGEVVVGGGGSNNTLTLANGATLTAPGRTIRVGSSAGADSNQVILQGGVTVAGVGTVLVGDGGSLNSLTMSDASLAASQVNIGQSGDSNVVSVGSNASIVANGHFYIGAGSGADGNDLLVSGAAAAISTIFYDINVGNNGANCELQVANGAVATAHRSVIIGGGSSANGNAALVTGAGSALQIDTAGGGEILVGNSGSNNSLTVEAGAQLTATGRNLRIGAVAGADSNQVVLQTGAGAAGLNTVYVGYAGDLNSLTASDATLSAGGFNVGQTGSDNTLTIGGNTAATASGHFYIGASSGADGNKLVVDGATAAISTNSFDINIGNSGSNCELTVQNGASATANRSVILGVNSGSTGNTALVTGAGSLLQVNGGGGGEVIIGKNGGSNSLTVDDGAELRGNGQSLRFGSDAAAGGNIGLLDNADATNFGAVRVGADGGANSLTLQNNASLDAGSVYIGNPSSGNTLTVGPDAIASAGGHFYVGIGTGASGNTLTVTGSGTLLSTTSFDLTAGESSGATGNTIRIEAGAIANAARSAIAGNNASATGNALEVSGAGSLLTVGSGLVAVGDDGDNNTLTVDNSGQIDAQGRSISVGVNSGADNNTATFTSGGSAINVGSLFAGDDGQNNQVIVTAGASIAAGSVFVGDFGLDNTLTIGTGSSVVSNGHFYIGHRLGADGNKVVVSGPGALAQTLNYDVNVGYNGANGELEISNGGQVIARRDVFVGTATTATNALLHIIGGSLQNTAQTDSDTVVRYGGTLSVEGTGGTIQVRDLELLDSGNLVCTLDASGITPIQVAGVMRNDAATTLTVDATAFANSGGGTVTLVSYGSKNQDILAGNISLAPAGTTIDQNDNSAITITAPNNCLPLFSAYYEALCLATNGAEMSSIADFQTIAEDVAAQVAGDAGLPDCADNLVADVLGQ